MAISWPSPAPGTAPEVYESLYLGLTQTNLTKSATVESRAVLLPDGKKLSFTSDRLGNDNIFKMNTDGSSRSGSPITRPSDFDSDWGMAGSAIAPVLP